MSAQPVERLERWKMSYEQYLALPGEVRAEYVNGEAVVSPLAEYGHQRVALRLARLFEDHLAELGVGLDLGVRTAPGRYRLPDVAVVEPPEDEGALWIELPPILVVEVLSRSTRSEDLIRKAPEYLAAGVGQYWIVDRNDRSITVLRAGDGEWEIALTIDDDNPTGEVQVGDHGTVPLDLTAIMPT